MDSKAQKYIALLRGINISGRNKVPMAELKKGFESLSFTAVRTWLNSGNVSFLSSETDPAVLTEQIEKMLQAHFHFPFPSSSCRRRGLQTFWSMPPTGGELQARRSTTI